MEQCKNCRFWVYFGEYAPYLHECLCVDQMTDDEVDRFFDDSLIPCPFFEFDSEEEIEG